VVLMLVLRKELGIEVLAGEPRPGHHSVYVRLRHPKLPQGGVIFAFGPHDARKLADRLTAVAGEVDAILQAS
jgi:hypothetical protein